MVASWKSGTSGTTFGVSCGELARYDIQSYDDARRLAKEWSHAQGLSAKIYEIRNTHVHTEVPGGD